MALTAMQGLENAILSQITQPSTTAAGVLDGVKLGLFTNSPVITKNTLLSDLTAPTTTGLGLSSAVVWGTTYNAVDGRSAKSSDLKSFICSGTVTPESVMGYYIVAGSGSPTVPLAVEMLADPVTILHDGDGLNLAVIFSPSQTDLGSSVVID